MTEGSTGPEDTPPDDPPEETTDDNTEPLTYAAAGVDVEASERATRALVSTIEGFGSTTDYAGLVKIGDQYLALATDGVGTKLLVAEAVGDFSTIGVDCMAMNVNDLVASGVRPAAFVDYLAVEEPDEGLFAEIGDGLATAADLAGVALVGGETAVMPEVVSGFDLAGTAAGIAAEGDLFPGEARVGDALVGFPSSGIHSNGLTLARKAATRNHEYDDPFPPDPDRTVGEALLEPTRIYTGLLDHLRGRAVHAAAHVTGGGWTNLARMGDDRYEITDPFPARPIFEFVQREGNVSDAEMHRTFNMGTGFVVAVGDDGDAESIAAETDGRVIGRVEDGDGVAIRGLAL